jgi:hypothetical protein
MYRDLETEFGGRRREGRGEVTEEFAGKTRGKGIR